MTHRIAIVTTVHARTDTRIAVKEAASLAAGLDAEIALFVQDGLGDAEGPVPIRDTGKVPGGRRARATRGAWRMMRAVRRWGADIVHFHDPELIWIGLLLRAMGVRVVYDVHEDVPRQILSKHYLSRPMARVLSACAALGEGIAGRAFSGIAAATPIIAARFPQDRTMLVRNFPRLSEFPEAGPTPFADRPPHLAYVGGIAEIRGGRTMVEALEACGDDAVRLRLAGAFVPERLGETLRALPGWDRVEFLGWADRAAVVALLGSVRGGLVLLHPTPNYVESLPVKMFEYMAAGLPVIASDFPIWREIVEGAGCGLLVDPLDIAASARAMAELTADPARAQAMGARGRAAIETTYNWEAEAEGLLTLYVERFGVTPRAAA